jgi:predicted glycogen debranching enzyme
MPLYTIETYGELEPHLSQEWIQTNGLGSFAMSSVVGCNTRRYHGLLCAAVMPPVGRVMALNRIGESVRLDRSETTHELSVNAFRDNIFPRGERYLRRFELGDVLTWDYEVEGVRIKKELHLFWKRDVVALRYTIEPNGRHVELHLRPFVSLRDFRSLRHKDGAEFEVHAEKHLAVVTDERTNQKVEIRSDKADFAESYDWWYGHKYGIETERGLDDTEDLFTPGGFYYATKETQTVTLWASMESVQSIDWNAEVERRRANGREIASGLRQSLAISGPSKTLERLLHAANDFVVDRKSPDGSPGVTVIAGYPWFADWGRDTMISLPGLLLSTGRFAEAGQVLCVFAKYVSDGMIPNRFDDYTNEPHYNTVDASLWFIHAAYEYLRLSKDQKIFDTTLLPACRAIIDGYRRGTRFNIKMDERDGLINQGDATTQLTWMDAKDGDVVFTPRSGKAVEINALWYNALMLMGEKELAAKMRESFAKAFWISPFRGLCDVVNDNWRDMSIRPNQIFAVSLPHCALSHDQQLAVVEVVRRELLTPYGLRTLAASDPKYRAKYIGNQFERDGAYHNGTIWPWLIGPFLEAYLRVNNRSKESIAQGQMWLKPLIDSMNDQGCIGSISECYEADPPHRPVGTPAQAWSVAEALRLAIELGL